MSLQGKKSGCIHFHPIGISGAEMTLQSGLKAEPKLEKGLGLNTSK